MKNGKTGSIVPVTHGMGERIMTGIFHGKKDGEQTCVISLLNIRIYSSPFVYRFTKASEKEV